MIGNSIFLLVVAMISFSTLSLHGDAKPFSTSVIIPCHSVHLKFLPQLLDALEMQSDIPDEVVVSISSSGSDDDALVAKLEEMNYSFSLKLLRSAKRLFAGDNRNIAIAHSFGDLIICQDADDLPHKQRVELIKHIFKKNDFDLLLHLHILLLPDKMPVDQIISNMPELPKDGFDFIQVTPKTILYNIPTLFLTKFTPPEVPIKTVGVHMGNCAFKRTLFNTIQYTSTPSGQDAIFVQKTINKSKKVLVVNLPLIYYFITRTTLNIREKTE